MIRPSRVTCIVGEAVTVAFVGDVCRHSITHYSSGGVAAIRLIREFEFVECYFL